MVIRTKNLKYVMCLIHRGFPGGASGKESACNAGELRNMGSIPELGRSPGGGHGNPLQYSCLENSVERGACGLQFIGSQTVRHDWATDA